MNASLKPDYTALDLPEPPPHRPYVLTNMVTSVDGKITIEGNEQGIGSKTDQRLMRELRVNCDCVLNGANTLRKSGASPRLGDPVLERLRESRGLPRLPISSVLTRSGEMPLDRAFFRETEEFDAVVFADERIPDERREAIQATGRPVVLLPADDPVPELLRYLREERGVKVLLLEGGADINRAFLDADALDEYFTTIGPVLVGGRSELSAVGGDASWPRDQVRHLELLSAVTNPATNEIYTRWRVQRAASA